MHKTVSKSNFSSEQNQLRVLIDNLPDYIYFKDTSCAFVDANKATLHIMKCKSREELIGKTDFDFYPKEFAQKFFEDECEILATGKSKINIEELIVDESQQIRVLSTAKVVLRDAEGNIIGLVGIGKDITERKQAEEVLKRDNEVLGKLIKERTEELLEVHSEFDKNKRLSDIGTLAAMVAHDLRNPLGTIQLSIYNLKKNHGLSENKYLMNIEKKLLEGNRIIDNLLNYSRLKPPVYEIVDLFGLLDECIANSQIRFHDHEIIIERQYDKNVSTIEIDPNQVKEVFLNILNNAAQAFVNKTGKIDVIVQGSGERVSIIFKDNGAGIGKDNLDKIFIPFFTSKSKGTGLGLSVCQEIVSLHGGKIEVTSIKGEGSAFSIILPIRNPHSLIRQ